MLRDADLIRRIEAEEDVRMNAADVEAALEKIALDEEMRAAFLTAVRNHQQPEVGDVKRHVLK